jgi:hypothetical protein
MITIFKDVISGARRKQPPPKPQPADTGAHQHTCPNPACGKVFDCPHGGNCKGRQFRPRCCSQECLRRATVFREWYDLKDGRHF